MISQRQLFLNHVAQTSPAPIGLEIEKAEGVYLYDIDGKKYIDLISGISVSNIGHCHPKVTAAISQQSTKYMHLMVYGEYVQAPQVELAKKLSDNLPNNLNSCYFTNSGSEAIEGAIKLAKRYTKRTKLISCKNAYHGSTHGALSLMGNEYFKQSFRPLLPEIYHIEFNNFNDLELITPEVACVVIETIQGEAGVIVPQNGYLKAVADRCKKTGTLLILDEIQCGFGRTGKLFAFEHFGITPDILCLAKGMGGGMPIGTFISSKQIMDCLTNNPVLGHITTFGGNAVCCAASLATLNVILEDGLMADVESNEKLFKKLLHHPKIKEIRGIGLLLAVQLENAEQNFAAIEKCIKNGVITDWFLFNDSSMRIAPPLTITTKEIEIACAVILEALQ